MWRTPLALVLVLGYGPVAQTGADEPEVRWVAYVRGSADTFTGSLAAVLTTGERRTSLAGDEISRIAAGPDGVVYGIREGGLEPPELLRTRVEGSAAHPVDVGSDRPLVTDVAVSPTGALAFLRFVDTTLDVPGHLEGALDTLAMSAVPILAPPQRPPGTTGTVPDATQRFYRLLFTNDPEGALAHVDQINVSITGSTDPEVTLPQMAEVPVRDTMGSFGCGASACFLQWEELDTTYSIGEFEDPSVAAAFAESLVNLDELLGPTWRGGLDFQVPELVVRGGDGQDRIVESVRQFCECGFRPVAWDPMGRDLLVIFAAEGFTSLQEYRSARGEPTQLLEGDEELILDADYGPDEILVLTSEEFAPTGEVRTLSGETLVSDVRSFDVEGSTLAYVNAGGDVMIRDLAGGTERRVAREAIQVALGPDLIRGPVTPERPRATRREPGGGGLPWETIAIIGGAAGLLAIGSGLLIRSRRD